MRFGGRRFMGRGAAVSDANVGRYADTLTITSGTAPGMVPTDTHQIAWLFTNSVAGDTIIATPDFSSDDEGVATVDAAGLVTAVGAGTATITASKFGLRDTIGVTVAVTFTPDTMTVTPSSATIEVGATVTLDAVLSESGVPLPNRTFTPASADEAKATVGAMNTTADPMQTVVATAVAEGGPINITVTDNASSLSDTCALTVIAAGGEVAPSAVQDFGYTDTADLLSPTHAFTSGGKWSYTEDVQRARITLEADGPPGAPVAKCMQYSYPDRIGLGPPLSSSEKGYCADFTISRRYKDPLLGGTTIKEMWVEVWMKFSANYNHTSIPECAGGVPGGSSPGYKLHFVDVNPATERFHLIVHPTHWEMTSPNGTPTDVGDQSNLLALDASGFYNNAWWRCRYHAKVNSPGSDVWGANICDLNGVQRFHRVFTGLTTLRTSLRDFRYGANRNQGPINETMWIRSGYTKLWYNTNNPGWGW